MQTKLQDKPKYQKFSDYVAALGKEQFGFSVYCIKRKKSELTEIPLIFKTIGRGGLCGFLWFFCFKGNLHQVQESRCKVHDSSCPKFLH
jgi:hypothetical protein